MMSTWHKIQGKQKAQPRRSGWKSKGEFVTRFEHDAKNDALLQMVRAESATLRSDIATFRGDMVERFGKVEGEITGVKGQIEGLKGEIQGVKGEVEGLKGSLNTTQWVVGTAISLLALLTQVPSIISAYRFPPAGSSFVPAVAPVPPTPGNPASSPGPGVGASQVALAAAVGRAQAVRR